jgi:hypothetical protein
MQPINGFVSVEANKNAMHVVLVVTEIASDIPSGSRTATLLLNYDEGNDLINRLQLGLANLAT